MIEFCGLIGGVASRLFVWASDYLNKKQQHEQDMERMQAETELERAKTDANLSTALQNQHTAPPDSCANPSLDTPPRSSYVDIANSLVRPTLTFWYCLFLYTLYKGFLLYSALNHQVPFTEVATEFDRTVVASMISYWFTDRTFHKLGQ